MNLHVVAGALIGARNRQTRLPRILIAQRPVGKHLAGGWEFPGGKLEAGEARSAGLTRELREELGIAVEAAHPLICVRHAYPDRSVLLDIWVVTRYRGSPRGLDGQSLQWCTPEELVAVDMLPADAPVIAALRLPPEIVNPVTDCYVIGDPAACDRPRGDARLRGALCPNAREAFDAAAAGAQFIVMRHRLGSGELAGLCAALNTPVFARGMPLESARALGATGVNLIRFRRG